MVPLDIFQFSQVNDELCYDNNSNMHPLFDSVGRLRLTRGHYGYIIFMFILNFLPAALSSININK